MDIRVARQCRVRAAADRVFLIVNEREIDMESALQRVETLASTLSGSGRG